MSESVEMAGSGRIRWSTRLSEWIVEKGVGVLGPVSVRMQQLTWMSRLPSLPHRPAPPWPDVPRATPEHLKTVAGVVRDERAADAAFRENPIYEFFVLHSETRTWLSRYGWAWQIPTTPMRVRFRMEAAKVSAPDRQPVAAPPAVDPAALAGEVRAEARRLGLSRVGFARYDPRYTFAGVPAHSRESVIVCLLEQDWEPTQTIPSLRAERAAMRTYSELVSRAVKLTEFLHRRGFRAEEHGPGGAMLNIPYGVAAGLGQLGLNGQLLTPEAGSRCRITVITTSARLAYDRPVDYGIHKICDACQLCVKRCPPGAIPNKREYHRGVLKARIKPDRCLPTLAQAHGCAVCMKVCPVQRYGLDAVTSHHLATGTILGKGTDELEGYDWLDGRHYGPGTKPRITRQFIQLEGITVDAHRKVPPGHAARTAEEEAEGLTIA